MKESRKIVLLAGKGQSTNIVFNSLNKNFGIMLAIVEDKESTKVFLKRRIKRLGIFTVIGQIAFQLWVAKPLGYFSKKRQKELLKNYDLDDNEIPTEKKREVNSINSNEAIELLKELNPDLIIVNGTRIISKKVLAAVQSKFINTHAGITPKYRGVHGTYWALANNDLENSGVTVHFVDEGIDTGSIINQSKVSVTKEDNFSTYPLLQLAEGLKILNQAVSQFFDKTLVLQNEKNLESKLWYHPTIWQYIYYRITRGVK